MNFIDNLRPDERSIISSTPVGSARIFGSALIDPGGAEDVDVAVRDGDDATFARLLHAGTTTRIRPIRFPAGVFEDLENRLSWKNVCSVGETDGSVKHGRGRVEGRNLEFNAASREAFPAFQSALRSARKLVLRGHTLPYSEVPRMFFHLDGDIDSLRIVAEEALTETIVDLLTEHGAVVAGGFFRDEVDGRRQKDLDVFVPAGKDWNGLCNALSHFLEEIRIDCQQQRRLNLRKFKARSRCPGHENLVLDVIDYGFVYRPEHVVETFDLSVNMLWWAPATDNGIHGSSKYDSKEIVRHIRERILMVGDNMWFRARPARAIRRWQRFREDGYVADEATTKKYTEYVLQMMGK